MLTFQSKDELFGYLVRKFKSGNNVILIRGSTAHGTLKQFSDVDVEIYEKSRKPYYDIAFVGSKLILVTIYFYPYKAGKPCFFEDNVRVLYGEYNDNLKPIFKKDTYNSGEKTIRECQLLIDSFFKYLRTKDKKYLEAVKKRINP